MSQKLRILHLEDDPADVLLVANQLVLDGLAAEIHNVTNREDFFTALAGSKWDLVLSSYLLKGFSGMEALKLVRERFPRLPFCLIPAKAGGTVNPGKTAADTVWESDRERLSVAVGCAVQEALVYQKSCPLEAKPGWREKYLLTLTENTLNLVSVLDGEGKYIHRSVVVKRVLGYESQETVGRSYFDYIHPKDVDRIQREFQALLRHPGGTAEWQLRCRHKDGSWRRLESTARNLLADTDIGGVVINFRDVTDRWRVEEELRHSEKYFRTLTENALDLLSIIDVTGNFIYKSPSVKRVLGYEVLEALGRNCFEYVHPEDVERIRQGFLTLLQQPGGTAEWQLRYRHKDGSWHRLESIARNLLADPDINGVVINSRDVTDRWRMEEELRQSEKQYRLLFQGNPHPMWVFDLETLKIAEVNEEATLHYGYSREEFLTKSLPDLRVKDRNLAGQAPASDPESKGVVWLHEHKNGTVLEMDVIWSPLVFRGRLSALTMAVDVTARRRAAQRNELFGKLSHRLSVVRTAAEAGMSICGAADELFRWDDFALDLYLEEKDEVISLLTITTVEGRRVEIPAFPQPKTANVLVRRVIARGAELVSALETGEKSGTTMLAPIRKGQQVIGVLFIQKRESHSYTEHDLETLQTLADQCGGALQRVRAEENLRDSEQRFRDLFENSPDAIFVEDKNGKVLDANAGACALHGLIREELIGKNSVDDLVPLAYREAARLNFHKLVEGLISSVEGESFRADGRSVPVEARMVQIEFEGEPALLFHVRDISERHAAEVALRSSETLFRSVWENSVDGMRLTDENGIIMATNGAFCRLVGMSVEQLEGKPLTVIYSNTADNEKELFQHREHFRAGSLADKHERQYRLHDGRSVVFEITDFYVKSDGKPRLLLSLFRDVTIHKRLEEQLRQSQKMEAIGQLAGGVAHDFNNILTIILGHATLLTMTPLEPKLKISATQIKQASERAAGLTRQLLAFGRKQVAKPRPLDINRVIGNMTEMLGRLLGEDIALQLNFNNEPAVVEADISMMEQIFLNLSVNSRDAMPRGGTLSIRVKEQEVGVEHTQHYADARAGRFVCLTHSDTGMGIPAENLTRIFEPFFTTKELGKGTGLGLATVYGIVKQHRGWIEVESELGKGTTFRIFLPATQAPIPALDANGNQPSAPVGHETILIVEDERDLREIITHTLNCHGYRVFQAVDGNNALKIWEQYKDDIALVFTDVIMPGGINGRELAEQLVKQKPELKVIYSTGYSADALGKDFRLNPDLNYLQKPYLPDDLARIVRRRLDSKVSV